MAHVGRSLLVSSRLSLSLPSGARGEDDWGRVRGRNVPFVSSQFLFHCHATPGWATTGLRYSLLYCWSATLLFVKPVIWNGHFGAIFVTERSCVAPNVESGTSHIGWVSSTLIKRVISEASLFPLLLFIYYRDMS